KLSSALASGMVPPPVTQQPPLEGGWQSSVVSLGTQAPQALGCDPSLQVGGWLQSVELAASSVSQSKGGGGGPSPASVSAPPSHPHEPPGGGFWCGLPPCPLPASVAGGPWP